MKKYASLNFVLAFLLLSAPLAWGCANDASCHQQDLDERQQLVPGDQAPQQSQPKLRTRGLVLGEEAGARAQVEAPPAGAVPVPERDTKSLPQQGEH